MWASVSATCRVEPPMRRRSSSPYSAMALPTAVGASMLLWESAGCGAMSSAANATGPSCVACTCDACVERELLLIRPQPRCGYGSCCDCCRSTWELKATPRPYRSEPSTHCEPVYTSRNHRHEQPALCNINHSHSLLDSLLDSFLDSLLDSLLHSLTHTRT